MNKEKIKVGDILESDENIIAYVDKILPKKVRVWIDRKRDCILDEQLYHWKYANPIKDNRIVGDHTFAVRFKQFLKWIPKEWWMSQCHYFEEYEYIMDIANQLLNYQIQTTKNEDEIDYLKRLKLYE